MTTDVAITQDDTGTWDLSLNPQGDLENGDFFDSSLTYSLLGERRASPSEVSISHYRRGWIGNEGEDFENGSKIWLYEQSRLTRTVLNGIQSEALAGLQWLVDDGLLVKIDVSAFIQEESIFLDITLYRTDSKIDKRFFELWNNTGVM